MEQIAPNLYRLEVPLPGSPLKIVNSYLVRGQDQCLIIDTGMNHPECEKALSSQLDALGVNPQKADYFITHLHMDHFGLVGRLAGQSSKTYFHHADKAIIYQGFENHYWERNMEEYLVCGFPPDLSTKVVAVHPSCLFSVNSSTKYINVADGDSINAGDYHFLCIETPGHSPGHTCLYEANKGILISGDHILFDISPNITFWLNFHDSLGSYLSSLDKIYKLNVSIVLPGHRSPRRSLKDRIVELKEHHSQRLDEIRAILGKGARNAYDIAPFISWDSYDGNWDQFPPQQKFFATGEIISHLDYLLARGHITKKIIDGIYVYSLI